MVNGLRCLSRNDADPTSRASVFSLVKRRDIDSHDSMVGIYALDNDLSKWWSELQPDLKLDPRTIADVPKTWLSRMLLINLIYHQSLCALHASSIPLFSWVVADESWSTARRSQAQIAFEHACEASSLMAAVISIRKNLNPAHTFIAYAAYSGCAIQVPFMWCSNAVVRQRAITNVQTNVKVIQMMAQDWKFAALLVGGSFSLQSKCH